VFEVSFVKVVYSVVVPVYNNADTLKQLHARISRTMSSLGAGWELILVNDGSRDESLEILRQIHSQDPHVKVIELLRNFGQHPAVSAGFDACVGDIVITLDADLQNPPEEIPHLVARLNEGFDLVTGWRTVREDPLLRKLPSLVVNAMMRRITGSNLRDIGCMLRVYNRQAIEYLKQCPEKGKFIPGLTSWLRLSTCEISVAQDAREGKSSYNFVRLFRMLMDLITGYTMAPIQMMVPAGAFLLLVGLSLGASLLFTKLGHSAAAITVFGVTTVCGVQLLTLGIIGEYIGRIFVEVQQRPYYLVRQVHETRPEQWTTESHNAEPGFTDVHGVVRSVAESVI
jgi:undecaprenyl-phosphate 4-deoxy-4-formamido-L-arabinose transferase